MYTAYVMANNSQTPLFSKTPIALTAVVLNLSVCPNLNFLKQFKFAPRPTLLHSTHLHAEQIEKKERKKEVIIMIPA